MSTKVQETGQDLPAPISCQTFEQGGILYKCGDHVELRNPAATSQPYVARIKEIHMQGKNVSVLVQWYYRSTDVLPKHARLLPEIIEHEIFETLHQDVNDVESIIGKCAVHRVRKIPPFFNAADHNYAVRLSYVQSRDSKPFEPIRGKLTALRVIKQSLSIVEDLHAQVNCNEANSTNANSTNANSANLGRKNFSSQPDLDPQSGSSTTSVRSPTGNSKPKLTPRRQQQQKFRVYMTPAAGARTSRVGDNFNAVTPDLVKQTTTRGMLASAHECNQVWSPLADGQLDEFLSAAHSLQIRPGCLVHLWMDEDLKPAMVTALNHPGTTRFTIDAMLLEDEYRVRSVDMSRVVGFHLSEERLLHCLQESGFDRAVALVKLREKTNNEVIWEELLPTLWTAKDREGFALALKRAGNIISAHPVLENRTIKQVVQYYCLHLPRLFDTTNMASQIRYRCFFCESPGSCFMHCMKPKCRYSICNKCSEQTEMSVASIGQWTAVRKDLAWLCPQCCTQNQIASSSSTTATASQQKAKKRQAQGSTKRLAKRPAAFQETPQEDDEELLLAGLDEYASEVQVSRSVPKVKAAKSQAKAVKPKAKAVSRPIVINKNSEVQLPAIGHELIAAAAAGNGKKPVLVTMGVQDGQRSPPPKAPLQESPSLVGRAVVNGVFKGRVIGQRTDNLGVEWYTLAYDDGDQEDIIKDQLLKMLEKSKGGRKTKRRIVSTVKSVIRSVSTHAGGEVGGSSSSNNGGSSKCSSSNGGSSSRASLAQWACWACTLMNQSRAKVCAACGTSRPVQLTKQVALGRKSPPRKKVKQKHTQSASGRTRVVAAAGDSVSSANANEIGLAVKSTIVVSVDQHGGDTFPGWNVPVIQRKEDASAPLVRPLLNGTGDTAHGTTGQELPGLSSISSGSQCSK